MIVTYIYLPFWCHILLSLLYMIAVNDFIGSSCQCTEQRSKVKVGVLRPVQQPGSYWDRSSELPLVGLEPTEVTAYD